MANLEGASEAVTGGVAARDAGSDLCVTCRFLEDCSYRRERGSPVQQCELFEEGTSTDQIARIIAKHGGARGGLISILEAIQATHGYLPEPALRMVAEELGRPLVDIYGVATFYKAFNLEPKGKHVASVCVGTACHVRNAPAVVEEFEKHLCVCAGNTTEDQEFTLETVNCLGACALGPIVVVDGHYFSQVETGKVPGIIEKTRSGLDRVEVETDRRVFPVEVCCARCNRSLMDHENILEGFPSVRVTISFGRKHGWLRLSSLYGSYTIESEHPIPEETIANFFCPNCHAELAGVVDCPLCSAPMVPLIVRGGGMIQICSRRGCKSHMLHLSGQTF